MYVCMYVQGCTVYIVQQTTMYQLILVATYVKSKYISQMDYIDNLIIICLASCQGCSLGIAAGGVAFRLPSRRYAHQ